MGPQSKLSKCIIWWKRENIWSWITWFMTKRKCNLMKTMNIRVNPGIKGIKLSTQVRKLGYYKEEEEPGQSNSLNRLLLQDWITDFVNMRSDSQNVSANKNNDLLKRLIKLIIIYIVLIWKFDLLLEINIYFLKITIKSNILKFLFLKIKSAILPPSSEDRRKYTKIYDHKIYE